MYEKQFRFWIDTKHINYMETTSSPSSVCSPVFIVGMNGSGTSMLADSLGHHPDLYMFPRETRMLPELIMSKDKWGNLDDLNNRKALARYLGKTKAYWHANNETNVELTADELSQPGFHGVVDSLYRSFADKQGKQRWGDKTPMYIQHIKLLADAFPLARFVHIIRDGRDCAQSFHRRWNYDPKRTIYRWKKTVEDGSRAGSKLGKERYMEIFYEDLTENPERIMGEVCSFLGLAYSDDVLCSSMPYMVTSAQSNSGKIVQNSNKWGSYFNENELMELEGIAGRLLGRLGYEVIYKEGDKSPGLLARKLWEIKDSTHAVLYHVKNYGIKGTPALIKRIKSSLAQLKTNKY